MGNHRLIHGDCLQVLPTLPAASVDLVVADLPYGVTANRWDCAIPLAPLWAELLRVGTPRCVYVFTATMRFACTLLMSQPHMFRYDVVWHKNRATGWLNATHGPLRAHEHVLVFSRKNAIYFPQMTQENSPYSLVRSASMVKNYNSRNLAQRVSRVTTRYPQSILRVDRCDTRDGKGHPTQKPVALLSWLIRTYSAEGATVLDPTAGVMSTAVAAARTGRRSVSIERDATYYARGVERLRAELAQHPLPLAQRSPDRAAAAPLVAPHRGGGGLQVDQRPAGELLRLDG